MSAPVEFGGIDNARLAALVFELASQLHVERSRRAALEAALLRLGVLEVSQIEAAASEPACRRQSAELADEAIRKLLRVLTEPSDERMPLRAQAREAAPPPQVVLHTKGES